MPKSKKYTSKIYKVKKSNLRKSKRGGFSWSDISNWKPDFTNWKSTFTDKMNNFSIFKKKDTQLSSTKPVTTTNELSETKPELQSSPSYSSPSYSSPSYSSPSYSSPSYSSPSNFSEDSVSSNKVMPLYEAPKINNSINDNDGLKNTLPPSSFSSPSFSSPSFSSPSFSSPSFSSSSFSSSSLGTQQNTIDNEPKYSGGYRANHSLTNLASKAAPFWQPTAKPQVWVGGKIKKTYKSHKKNKSHKKHKKSYKKHH